MAHKCKCSRKKERTCSRVNVISLAVASETQFFDRNVGRRGINPAAVLLYRADVGDLTGRGFGALNNAVSLAANTPLVV